MHQTTNGQYPLELLLPTIVLFLLDFFSLLPKHRRLKQFDGIEDLHASILRLLITNRKDWLQLLAYDSNVSGRCKLKFALRMPIWVKSIASRCKLMSKPYKALRVLEYLIMSTFLLLRLKQNRIDCPPFVSEAGTPLHNRYNAFNKIWFPYLLWAILSTLLIVGSRFFIAESDIL